MTKYLLPILLIGVGFGQKNPCEEGLYIYLKNQNVKILNGEDKEILKRLAKECDDYESSLDLKKNQLSNNNDLINRVVSQKMALP